MQCEKASALMMARLDRQLDRQATLALDEHLAACDSCRVEWQRLSALDTLFKSAPIWEPPPNLRVQITSRINRAERARRTLAGGLTLALGTATLALLTLIPVAFGLVENLAVAPALVVGGVETVAQLLNLLDAVARLLIILLDQFARPFAIISASSLAVAVILNGLWITAMRRLRAAS